MKRIPRTSEQRSCKSKQRHDTLKLALRANAIMVRKGEVVRGELQPYLCRFCKGWHLGHPRQQHLKIRKLEKSA